MKPSIALYQCLICKHQTYKPSTCYGDLCTKGHNRPCMACGGCNNTNYIQIAECEDFKSYKVKYLPKKYNRQKFQTDLHTDVEDGVYIITDYTSSPDIFHNKKMAKVVRNKKVFNIIMVED